MTQLVKIPFVPGALLKGLTVRRSDILAIEWYSDGERALVVLRNHDLTYSVDIDTATHLTELMDNDP